MNDKKKLEKILNDGFKKVYEEGLTETYAKFTGCDECIQYYIVINGTFISNYPNTISLSSLKMFNKIYENLK